MGLWVLLSIIFMYSVDVSWEIQLESSEISANGTKFSDDDGAKSSLVFVFDTTGSMYNDLKQLRDGAEMILKTALEEGNVIADFVFVPFHDPAVGPATVTRDIQVFKTALNNVHVYGGGDCPEKSLGGIQLALNVSRPRSYMYVFTDATASDHGLVGKVLDGIQRRQTQVVFVLTGHCEDLNKPSFKVYQQIATASSGQVFNLNKTSVHKVLDFVKSSIKGRTVNLGSLVNPAGYNHTQEIPVDSTLGEVTVSVSGANPQLKVVNPSGQEITGPPQLITTLDLSEIVVVRVLNPEPGPWSITVGSADDYSVKVVGLSNLTFNHGFSVEKPRSMKETSYRPLQGTYNYMMISLTEIDAPVKVNTAEILNLDGKTLFEISLQEIDKANKIYMTKFLPPDEMFYIAIKGRDEYNLDLKRIGATAVQVKLPDVPYLSAPKKVEAHSHERVVLKCDVESLVPVKSMWLKDNTKLQEPLSSLQTTSIEYVIEDVRELDVGTYRCVGKNAAGISNAYTELSVQVDSPQVTLTPENTTFVTEDLNIYCSVFSEALLLKFQLIFNGTDDHYVTNIKVNPNIEGIYTYNKTIIANDNNSGVYTCAASNRAGQSNATTRVDFKKPSAQILGPHALIKQKHAHIQLVCSVENADVVQWAASNGSVVSEHPVNGTYNAVMDLTDVTDDATFVCLASRGIRRAVDSVDIKILIKPEVLIEGLKNVTVMFGDQYELVCKVTARPQPRIVWHRETDIFLNSTVTRIGADLYSSVLILKCSNRSVAATYFCIGENSEGIHQDSVNVNFRRTMTIVQGFTDTRVQLHSQIELHCAVDAQPPAHVTWYHNGTALRTKDNLHVTNDNRTVYLQKVSFDELGVYTCEADNGYERVNVNGVLSVYGLVSPLLVKNPAKRTLQKGNSTIITCSVIKGNPEPTVTWQFKADSSKHFTSLPRDVKMNGDGSRVIISNASVDHAGLYRCVAENAIGRDIYVTSLVVQFPPQLSPDKKEELNSILHDMPRLLHPGQRVKFSCKVVGVPLPMVVWTKDERPVVYTNNIYLTDTNDLIIDKATEYDTGLFTCSATNPLGSTHQNFTLVVYVPPTILSPEIEPQQEFLEGQLVELPCRADGVPAPEVLWLHNGQPIKEGRKYIDESGLRFVANLTDFGEYTCVAVNMYGNTSNVYNVYIWVSPYIEPPIEVSAEVLIGSNATLQCDATGFPVPTIFWEFRGELLTVNKTDLSFDDVGNVFIKNASSEHEGVYTCIAENLAGVARKFIRFNVNEPPVILQDNYTGTYIATDMDTALMISCNFTGKPKPYVLWVKDDLYLDKDVRYDIDMEGTLVIKQPTVDLSGVYTCVAKNKLGAANKTVSVEIYPLPTQMQSEETQTSVTLLEGSNATVECPVTTAHKGVVKWYKDAQLISQGNLHFPNITRYNTSQYACVVTNAVGSAYALMGINVEWCPRFVNKLIESVEVVRGDDKYLDCEADGKPLARTKWLFNSKPLLGEDKERLKLFNIQIHQTGTYKCIVSNKHGTIVRSFTLDVLVPPFISEFDLLDVQLKQGVNATLECNAKGSPKPDVKWTYNNTKWHIVNSSLTTTNITIQSEGLFRCDATNRAGASHIVYRVFVVQPASIQELVMYSGAEGVTVDGRPELVLGTHVRLACEAEGKPTPQIQWIRNGDVIGRNSHDINYADLLLDNVQIRDAGMYLCVASNEGGMKERKIRLDVLEPPKVFQTLFDDTNSTGNTVKLEVISGQAFYMHCHPYGNPLPEIYWFKDGLPLRLFDETMISTDFGEIIVSNKALEDQSGNYTCVARSKVGETSVVYLVDVLVPPPTLKESSKPVETGVGTALNLTCPVEGIPTPNVMWIKHPYTEITEDTPNIQLFNDNITLIFNNTKIPDSGNYTCIMTNKVGATEYTFDVTVVKPPSIDGNVGNNIVENHVVPLKRSIVLKCEVDGHPMPKINWLKDTQQLSDNLSNIQRVLGNSLLTIWSIASRDGGQYICIAENSAGTTHRRYNLLVQVPGKWSQWSGWSYCNVTCGLGFQQRNRYCHYVDDYITVDKSTKSDKVLLDESACKGPTVDNRKCHMPPCEVEESQPRWSLWSRWSQCSASCGAGTQARTRRCRTKLKCYGDNVQIRKCPDLPKCDSNQDNTENEVLTSVEEITEGNPYLPEAIFEMQPEVVNSHNPDVEEFYIHQASKPPVYFEVNVTENLDFSERGPCDPGYRHNASAATCDDIDECLIDNNHCHGTQVCENTLGGYRCTCSPGYVSLGAGQRCLDINECVQDVAGCEFACVNVAGGYVCACPRTMRLHADKHHCVPPSLYRSRPYEELGNEEYLSTSVDFPAKYLKSTKNIT